MRRRLITLLVIVLIALLLALLFFFLQSGSGKVSYAHVSVATSSPYAYEFSLVFSLRLCALLAYAPKAPGKPFYTALFVSRHSARCS